MSMKVGITLIGAVILGAMFALADYANDPSFWVTTVAVMTVILVVIVLVLLSGRSRGEEIDER